jgi:predicted nucleic acid-binding protein
VATPSRIAIGSTMAREVVLDANVIVAQLDLADIFSARAHELGRRLRDEDAKIVLVDVLVGEAVSVICRRARERRSLQPNVDATLATVRNWAEAGFIRWTISMRLIVVMRSRSVAADEIVAVRVDERTQSVKGRRYVRRTISVECRKETIRTVHQLSAEEAEGLLRGPLRQWANLSSSPSSEMGRM